MLSKNGAPPFHWSLIHVASKAPIAKESKKIAPKDGGQFPALVARLFQASLHLRRLLLELRYLLQGVLAILELLLLLVHCGRTPWSVRGDAPPKS